MSGKKNKAGNSKKGGNPISGPKNSDSPTAKNSSARVEPNEQNVEFKDTTGGSFAAKTDSSHGSAVNTDDEFESTIPIGIASKVKFIDGKPLSRPPASENEFPDSGNVVLPGANDKQKLTPSKVRITLPMMVEVPTKANIVEKAPVSYATMVQEKSEKKIVNFRKLDATESRDGIDIVLPKESVREVTNRFQYTLVGYFLGKRLAYPVVESFVKNNWIKYGLTKIMMNGNGFFFFKFNAKAGMIKVLEEGPWMIRSVPLLLNEWSPVMSLKKEEIKNIAVWIRLHNVPLAAYTEDGLSLLASKLGTPKMLDAYTSSMCLESWGRSNFARALIDISADHDFKDELVIAIPSLDGEGYSTENIRVEYEWKPPKCKCCCIFGHSDDQCPKQTMVVQKSKTVVMDDGFQEVKKKAKKGVQIKQQKPHLVYRPISKPSSSYGGTNKPSTSHGGKNHSKVVTTNQYDLLNDYGDDFGFMQHNRSAPPYQDAVDFDADIDEHIEIHEEFPGHRAHWAH